MKLHYSPYPLCDLRPLVKVFQSLIRDSAVKFFALSKNLLEVKQ
jgi:hypothetical protein